MKKYKWIFQEFYSTIKNAKWYEIPYFIFASMILLPILLFAQTLEDTDFTDQVKSNMDFITSDPKFIEALKGFENEFEKKLTKI